MVLWIARRWLIHPKSVRTVANKQTDSTVIQLRGVSKRYADHLVVDQVNLSVYEGERFGLLGHNGAGKTTLIKLMLGLCQATKGEVLVQGCKIGGSSSCNVGYLPESVSFHGNMSGREVIRFYARLKRRTNAECDQLLEQVGLTGAAGQRVHTYSKGMRQRLGLAQAMLGNPTLMLLDEPTTGLDPKLRGLFYEVIAQRASAGYTALISSHALSEIEASVDRVAIMKHGSIVACGSLDELRREAGLPTTIRVHLPAGSTAAVAESLRGKVDVKRVNDRSVDLSCVDGQKVDVLKHLGGLDNPILDVDISPVKLEQLYEYFTAEGGDTR